jgi:hypothetical protein
MREAAMAIHGQKLKKHEIWIQLGLGFIGGLLFPQGSSEPVN